MSETNEVDEAAEAAPATVMQIVAAEALGTFVLVLFGCGAAVMANISDTGYVGIALAFGLAVMVMAYALGRVSGGHFNPAISLGAALGGRLRWGMVPIYMGAQVAGGILGGGVLLAMLQGFEMYDVDAVGLGQNFFGDQGGVALWAALVVELVLTFIFVMVVLAVTDERNSVNVAAAPAAIGLALTAIHLVAIPMTGTSVNPARSIGVGIFAGGDAAMQLWLFILAPLLGGALAGVLHPLLFGADANPVPGSGLNFGSRGKPVETAWSGDQWQAEQQWYAHQQWGQQPGQPIPQGQPGQPQQPGQAGQQQWGQPQQPQRQPASPATQPRQEPQQWGQPQQPQPGQPQQWGQQPAAPGQQQPQQWGQPQQPGGWTPPDDEDGRTQVRPGGV